MPDQDHNKGFEHSEWWRDLDAATRRALLNQAITQGDSDANNDTTIAQGHFEDEYDDNVMTQGHEDDESDEVIAQAEEDAMARAMANSMTYEQQYSSSDRPTPAEPPIPLPLVCNNVVQPSDSRGGQFALTEASLYPRFTAEAVAEHEQWREENLYGPPTPPRTSSAAAPSMIPGADPGTSGLSFMEKALAHKTAAILRDVECPLENSYNAFRTHTETLQAASKTKLTACKPSHLSKGLTTDTVRAVDQVASETMDDNVGEIAAATPGSSGNGPGTCGPLAHPSASSAAAQGAASLPGAEAYVHNLIGEVDQSRFTNTSDPAKEDGDMPGTPRQHFEEQVAQDHLDRLALFNSCVAYQLSQLQTRIATSMRVRRTQHNNNNAGAPPNRSFGQGRHRNLGMEALEEFVADDSLDGPNEPTTTVVDQRHATRLAALTTELAEYRNIAANDRTRAATRRARRSDSGSCPPAKPSAAQGSGGSPGPEVLESFLGDPFTDEAPDSPRTVHEEKQFLGQRKRD